MDELERELRATLERLADVDKPSDGLVERLASDQGVADWLTVGLRRLPNRLGKGVDVFGVHQAALVPMPTPHRDAALSRIP